MSSLTNHDHPLSTEGAAIWRLSSSSTFEVTVKARFGSVRVAGSIGLVKGLVRIDPDEQIRMSVTIDTAGLLFDGTQRDARLLSHRLPGLREDSLVRFASTEVTEMGVGSLHVSGALSVGATRVPLELEAQVTTSGRALELVATTVADHRRLGLTWIPAGSLKAPTELVVRARLIPITDEARSAGWRRTLTPRDGTTNRRYRLMARAA